MKSGLKVFLGLFCLFGFFFFFPILAMEMSAAYERDFVRIFILLAFFTYCLHFLLLRTIRCNAYG